jgi:putative NADPH-quinone reductase
MGKRIVIIQGHPDPAGHHYGHALARAYAQGAAEAGHELKQIDVAQLDFPLIRTYDDFYAGSLPDTLREAQDAIGWAQHLVLFYPLWHGTMPALFKGFLEQVLRPGFAFTESEGDRMPGKALTGRSARIVVTMGMPAFIYRWFFHAHGLKALEKSILGLCGIKPVRHTLIGMVEGNPARREKWLGKMRELGTKGK